MQTMNAILRETLTINAIKCEHTTHLEAILNKLKKSDLKTITDNHGLKGCSALNKAKLAERIIEALGEVNTLKYILCGFDQKMEAVFRSFLTNQIQPIEEVECQYIQQLCQLGYLYPVMDKKNVAIILPDHVKATFETIEMNDLEDEKAQYDQVYLYMRAFVNLYGVCELDEAIKMYNEATQAELSFNDAVDVLRCKATFLPHVQAIANVLVCDSLISEQDESLVFELRNLVADKPYYMPTKEEIELYGTGQIDWTPQLLKVKSFMMEQFKIDEAKADELVQIIFELFPYQYETKYAIMVLEQHGIVSQSFDVSQQFVQLVKDAYTHARLWENRGFKLAEIMPQESDWLDQSKEPIVVPTVSPLKSTKVGRNEPCSCGSQKKYKKCCGR